MSATKFTVKALKERLEDGELDISLSTLTELDVPIKEMKQLKKLKGLDLSCNVMKSLPTELCTFTQLTRLDVSKNMLTLLPENIGQLSNLQSLDILGNKLTTLPESFGDLTALRWLDVRENPLSSAILREAGDCLDDKQCKTCALRVVKLMNYVHIEREKQREQDRSKKEAEAQRLAEEAKQEKKRLKLEEKERKRQEFLSKQAMKAAESSYEHISSGDAIEKPAMEKSTSSTDVQEGSSMIGSFLSSLLTLFMFFTVIMALILGLYKYCESASAQGSLSAVCKSPGWQQVKGYVKNNIIPIVQRVQEMINNALK